jgi:hypothetical protein
MVSMAAIGWPERPHLELPSLSLLEQALRRQPAAVLALFWQGFQCYGQSVSMKVEMQRVQRAIGLSSSGATAVTQLESRCRTHGWRP